MSRRGGDEGSVLLLTLGLSVVLLVMVAVVVDLSVVVLAKRAVASAADGAAVAAAQQPDRAALEADPDALASRLPLDPQRVVEVVASYQADTRDAQPGLVLTASVGAADDSLVVVDGTRTVQLPFVGWLGVGQVQVHAVARARSPVR
ncbi:MAG: pilus assembly protein TadG-related protein [Mycobacteriales bacterium]